MCDYVQTLPRPIIMDLTVNGRSVVVDVYVLPVPDQWGCTYEYEIQSVDGLDRCTVLDWDWATDVQDAIDEEFRRRAEQEINPY